MGSKRVTLPANPEKDLARYILERTNNGTDIADRLIELGITGPCKTAADRRIAVAALEILLDRSVGGKVQRLELSDAGAGARQSAEQYRDLTDAELEVLARFPELARLPPGAKRAAAAMAALDAPGRQELGLGDGEEE